MEMGNFLHSENITTTIKKENERNERVDYTIITKYIKLNGWMLSGMRGDLRVEGLTVVVASNRQPETIASEGGKQENV